MKRHLRGLTLVEMLVIVAILSILAAILIPAIVRRGERPAPAHRELQPGAPEAPPDVEAEPASEPAGGWLSGFLTGAAVTFVLMRVVAGVREKKSTAAAGRKGRKRATPPEPAQDSSDE